MQDWSSFYWPDSDREARGNIAAEAMLHLDKLLARVPGRRVAVQAGGNVGLYPLAMARLFGTVHTFEPEPENYECLIANLERHPRPNRIIPHNAALGEASGNVALAMNRPGNTGTYRIAGSGDIQMQTIDSLGLPGCDLIYLDIEGYEVKALRGASATIDRHQPVVIVEDNGLIADGEETGAAIEWLHQRGYRKVVKHGNDVLLAPSETQKE